MILPLRINIRNNPDWNYIVDKRLNGGWNAYYGFENKCKLVDYWLYDKKNLNFHTLVTIVGLSRCEVLG